ncbi:MAG: 2'-deoxycytidine 5'-triphosphate deaminase [Candidatus Levybacteria bacterium]|nr:2'-deoxycytidine 5'-triphosphate deaminase [Candidatus Levybacteria bacterium]
MILGPKILLELVKTQQLVEGLSERELNNPEGAGFDLRLGEVYKITGDAFLGETERRTADIELVEKYVEGEKRTITFYPGDFYLVKTIESFNLPQDLTANFKPRSTTFRSGLFLRTGNVAPGYSGPVTFGMKNEGPISVTIEMGARFVHVQFEEVKGGGSMYRGQWQGGRVSATKKEKQV